MAKRAKKVQDVELEVKTKKVRVKAVKKEKVVDILVDTPNVDVTVHTDEKEKKFVLDSRKLDIEVTKTDAGTTVTVEAQTPMLKRAGKWIANMMSKKFNKVKK